MCKYVNCSLLLIRIEKIFFLFFLVPDTSAHNIHALNRMTRRTKRIEGKNQRNGKRNKKSFTSLESSDDESDEKIEILSPILSPRRTIRKRKIAKDTPEPNKKRKRNPTTNASAKCSTIQSSTSSTSSTPALDDEAIRCRICGAWFQIIEGTQHQVLEDHPEICSFCCKRWLRWMAKDELTPGRVQEGQWITAAIEKEDGSGRWFCMFMQTKKNKMTLRNAFLVFVSCRTNSGSPRTLNVGVCPGTDSGPICEMCRDEN